MQDVISGDALYTQVLMQRQVDSRLQLLVEGRDELSVLTGHVDEGHIFLLMGGGKPALIRVAELLHQFGLSFALVVVDRDLDDLTGLSLDYPPTLVATTGYDLATDVLTADEGLLRRAAIAHAGRECVSTIESATGQGFQSVVAGLAMGIAALRLVNDEHAIGMRLRNFPFFDVIDDGYNLFPIEKVLARVDARSKVEIDIQRITGLVPQAHSKIGGQFIYCGGHDLFEAAAAILRRAGQRGVGSSQIAASIYTAVACDLLRSLNTYSSIDDWARARSVIAFTC